MTKKIELEVDLFFNLGPPESSVCREAKFRVQVKYGINDEPPV